MTLEVLTLRLGAVREGWMMGPCPWPQQGLMLLSPDVLSSH